jgi:hypothetical protein
LDRSSFHGVNRARPLPYATIISQDAWHHARVENIYALGARVVCANPPIKNSEVIFQMGSLFAAAWVAGADGTGVRLQFYRSLDPQDLARGRSFLAPPPNEMTQAQSRNS